MKTTGAANPYAVIIEEVFGLDKIEFLQSHENMEIYQKAFDIIERYFGTEEEDKEVAAWRCLFKNLEKLHIFICFSESKSLPRLHLRPTRTRTSSVSSRLGLNRSSKASTSRPNYNLQALGLGNFP